MEQSGPLTRLSGLRPLDSGRYRLNGTIRDLMAPVYDGGQTGFTHDDLDDVRIVSSDFPTAGLYLPGERTAITLGPVIVLLPNLYEALFASSNNGVTYSDFLTDPAVCQT